MLLVTFWPRQASLTVVDPCVDTLMSSMMLQYGVTHYINFNASTNSLPLANC